MRQPTSIQPPWTQPGWLGQASDWIHARLEQQGITPTGPIEQVHIRPWSTVLRISTRAGMVYFKASAAALRHEPALTQALASWQPNCIPSILAADPQRGWMLMADGGMRLRELFQASRDLRHWEKVLPIYAEVQIALASRSASLLALGTPDRRLDRLPDLYLQLLEDESYLYIGQPEGLAESEYRRLREAQPWVAELCAALLIYPIPESINHGDFHDGNIFFNQGRFIFFDWGDSSLTHPFFSMRTVLVSLENTFGTVENSPESERLRAAYLEPWRRFATYQDLLVAYDMAQRLSPICSALGWSQALSSLDEETRQDFKAAVPGLLLEFLDNRTGAGS